MGCNLLRRPLLSASAQEAIALGISTGGHCSRHQYRRPLLSASVQEAIALGISTGDHCSRHQYRRPLLSASVQEAIALGISTEQYVQAKQRMNLTHLLGDEEHQGISIKEHNTCVIGTQDFE